MRLKPPSTYQTRLDGILAQFSDREPRPGAERRHIVRLWKVFVYPMRWRLFVATILAIVLSLEPYVWGFITKLLVDTVLSVRHPIPVTQLPLHFHYVILMFFGNCAIHTVVVLGTWQYSYQVTLIGQQVVYELRRALHEKLQALPLSFFDSIQTGRLLSVVLDDVATIQSSVASLAVRCIQNIGSVIVGVAILLSINWRMALLVFTALPFYVINFRHFRPLVKKGSIAARRATAVLYSKVEERIVAIRTVKVFNQEHSEVKSFAGSVNNMARLSMYLIRLQNWQNTIATIISSLCGGLILYFTIRQVHEGKLQLGNALFFYQTSMVLFTPAVVLSDITVEVQRVSVVLRRIFDILDAEPEPPDRPNAKPMLTARGDVRFDDVTFTYPGNETPTLHNISLTIPAGKQIAIMGPSGSGKSTLLYLLMRFYDPDSGRVLLDESDMKDLKLLGLRDRITLVMQEPVIFSGAVAENIRYGRLDASDEEVRRAARDADLHNFIMTLPDGYDTVVGERGMSLSGGQRQRLALAASLLSNPSVLLLDDTTSALDPTTEARVQETLNRLMRDRTCLVVTHRISTALASDLVMVLEEGRLTQFGAPEELLRQEGNFKRIHEQQIGTS